MPTTTASGTSGSSASDGKHGERRARTSRLGFTPHTGPAKPAPRRFSSVSPAYESSRSLAPTTAIAARPQQPAEVHQCSVRSTPAALQRARDDQPLDLARALPDAVHAQLAEEALGDVRAHVAASAEDLEAAVGAAVGGLAHEQLRHRRLRVHDLRVGAGVGQPRHLERQQPPGRGVRRRVGQREGHALVVDDPAAALLALDRPGGGVLDQPPHRAHPARRDPDPLLGEPGALEVVAAADAADHRVVARPRPR